MTAVRISPRPQDRVTPWLPHSLRPHSSRTKHLRAGFRECWKYGRDTDLRTGNASLPWTGGLGVSPAELSEFSSQWIDMGAGRAALRMNNGLRVHFRDLSIVGSDPTETAFLIGGPVADGVSGAPLFSQATWGGGYMYYRALTSY